MNLRSDHHHTMPTSFDGIVVSDTADDAAPPSPLRIVIVALRGRYRLALGLATLFALLGALAGYSAKPPKYESTGLVRIEAARAPILYESQENRAPPHFEAIVASKELLLQSRPIIDAALLAPAMRAAGWPAGPEGVAELQASLTVARARRDSLINVTITHTDPIKAEAAVNAILAEFELNGGADEGLTPDAKEQALLTREHALESELSRLRAEILEQSGQYGPKGIERRRVGLMDELQALDRRITDLRADGSVAAPLIEMSEPGEFTGDIELLSPRELKLLETRAVMSRRFLPDHPVIRDLDARLDTLQAQRMLRNDPLADAITGAVATDGGSTHDDAEGRLDQALEARARILTELRTLGAQQVAVSALTDRSNTITTQLTATRRRLDEVRLEGRASNPNRISIVAWGDRPVAPAFNHRTKLAGAGTVAGFLFGIGIVSLIGLLDRRARYADELAGACEDVDVIGALPDLAELGAAGRASASAAVNQIRTLLELDAETHPVIAVTSCARGAGRSSFAIALGTAFASAGRRVLIIDGDMSRPSLSRDIGGCEFLPDPLAHGAAQWPLRRTHFAGISALSAVSLAPEGPSELSRSALLKALAAARARFDVIIIDSGPVAESMEACLIASVADRVLLMVNRYRRLALVHEALTRLGQFGARVEGLVLNRAAPRDVTAAIPNDTRRTGPAPFMPAFTTPAKPGVEAEAAHTRLAAA
jgi:Mrp family chromosome partitioning ATPase